MVSISLCIIVKNEEKNLKRCLNSVKGFVDEIIAVDTGSTDDTKAILKNCGAKVFDFKWVNDFSEARNFGIKKASGDYILFLDADEKLNLFKPSTFKKYLINNPFDIIPIKIINLYGKKKDSRHSYFSAGLRLVKNTGDVKFINDIHERIDESGKTIDTLSAAQRHIQILHFGYMSDALKAKKGRNLLFLNNQENKADDPWINYHLAAEYYTLGQTENAIKTVNKAILLFIKRGLKPASLTYKLKYDLLITKHNFKDAYNGIVKAVMLYPDYVDLHFYKGILQYENCEYKSATKSFSYCLILGEENLNYLILSGCGSFLALYYLGLCYQKLNKPKEAAEAFSQANAIYPGLEKAKKFKCYLPQK